MGFAARLGDVCTGHDCFPPRPSITASLDTFIDGIPALRMGDKYDVHCCLNNCHNGVVIGGDFTTFINGLPAARVGDPIECGSFIATGSFSTFIG